MTTNSDNISQNENLMNEIKILSSKLKTLEMNKDYSNAVLIIDQISDKIKSFITENKLPDDNVKWLKILNDSYTKKKSDYEYFEFASSKMTLVKQKMAEKYLGKRKTLKEMESTNLIQLNNTTNLSEYEVVNISSSVTGILKDIIETCICLIKYSQVLNADKNIKSLKPIQSYESFYIYDYQNTTLNVSPHTILIEKYIDEIKIIRNECQNILNSDFQIDFSKVKSLEKQIGIIKEEFQKIYPKYQYLKEVLEKNNLVRGKNVKK